MAGGELRDPLQLPVHAHLDVRRPPPRIQEDASKECEEEPIGSAMARTKRSLELVVGAVVLGARWRRSGDAATAQRSAYGGHACMAGVSPDLACAASPDLVGDVQPAMAGAEGLAVSPELAGPTPSMC